ncbi:hypothetical protein [Labedella endophytica]|uniref:Uncharacterized protein n=1 Tax=Labedella endophytica TaxID=1523160 RepID=A0A3S0XKI7_9MICO|nr:hypothetical protein [Labedella endophytica]RUQ98079.1 hypothetical protein ELQ94_13695 [Labedella endophytica]
MRPRPTLRRLAAASIAAVLAMGLAGCGDVNAGTGAIEKLEAVVGRWDETVGVDSAGHNDLPWAGTAEATVIVEEDTEPARVAEMAGELADFLDDSEGGTARWMFLDLQIGEFRMGVSTDGDRRSGRLDLLDAVRSDERVEGGFVVSADETLARVDDDSVATDDAAVSLPAEGAERSLRILVANDVPLDEAFSFARTAAVQAPELDDLAVVAQHVDGRSAVTDSEGTAGGTSRSAPPTASLGFAAAIAAASDVMSVVATSDSLSVRLSRAADVDAVRATFERQAVGVGIGLEVAGGIVTDDGTADSAAIAVAGALDGAAGVTSVFVSRSSIEVVVEEMATVPSAVGILSGEPEVSALEDITIRTSPYSDRRVSMTTGPDGVAALGELADAAGDEPTITLLGSDPSGVRIEVDDTSVESLTSLFSAIRPVLDDGSVFSIRGDDVDGAQYAQNFTVADDIVIDVPEGSTAGTADFAVRVRAAWAASA